MTQGGAGDRPSAASLAGAILPAVHCADPLPAQAKAPGQRKPRPAATRRCDAAGQGLPGDRGLTGQAATGRISPGPSARLELTCGSTLCIAKVPAGCGTITVAAPCPASPSHSGHWAGLTVTGSL